MPSGAATIAVGKRTVGASAASSIDQPSATAGKRLAAVLRRPRCRETTDRGRSVAMAKSSSHGKILLGEGDQCSGNRRAEPGRIVPTRPKSPQRERWPGRAARAWTVGRASLPSVTQRPEVEKVTDDRDLGGRNLRRPARRARTAIPPIRVRDHFCRAGRARSSTLRIAIERVDSRRRRKLGHGGATSRNGRGRAALSSSCSGVRDQVAEMRRGACRWRPAPSMTRTRSDSSRRWRHSSGSGGGGSSSDMRR